MTPNPDKRIQQESMQFGVRMLAYGLDHYGQHQMGKDGCELCALVERVARETSIPIEKLARDIAEQQAKRINRS